MTEPTTEGQAADLAEFVLVPREITPKMRDCLVGGRDTLETRYQRMLAAAPSPDSSGETGQHKWVRSTLGHGEQMCEYCKGTNRELAALGQLNHCDKAPALATPPQKPGMVTVDPVALEAAKKLTPLGREALAAPIIHAYLSAVTVGQTPQPDDLTRAWDIINDHPDPLDRTALAEDLALTFDAIRRGSTLTATVGHKDEAVSPSEIPALLDRYWALAYAEGKEGRDHDTSNGEAQEVRNKIGLAFLRSAPPSPHRIEARNAVVEEASNNLSLDLMMTIKGPRGEKYTINADGLATEFARFLSDWKNEQRCGFELFVPWYEAEFQSLRRAALRTEAPQQ